MIVGFAKSATVFKMRIGKAHILRSLVHQIYKFLLASCDKLCCSHAGIISGCHGNTLDDSVKSLYFPFLQKNLRTSHRFGISAGHDFTVKLHSSCADVIKNYQQGHNFGDAGRAASFIRILLTDNLARGAFH